MLFSFDYHKIQPIQWIGSIEKGRIHFLVNSSAIHFSLSWTLFALQDGRIGWSFSYHFLKFSHIFLLKNMHMKKLRKYFFFQNGFSTKYFQILSVIFSLCDIVDGNLFFMLLTHDGFILFFIKNLACAFLLFILNIFPSFISLLLSLASNSSFFIFPQISIVVYYHHNGLQTHYSRKSFFLEFRYDIIITENFKDPYLFKSV